MDRLSMLFFLGILQAASLARAQDNAGLAVLRAGCTDDAQKFCANVEPGGGRILQCLKNHKDSLSDRCKQAAQQAIGMSNGGAAATAPPSAPATPNNRHPCGQPARGSITTLQYAGQARGRRGRRFLPALEESSA